MSAATIFGAASGAVVAIVAMSTKWRRTAIWAAVAATTSGANLAFLIAKAESGVTYFTGLMLLVILFVVLLISYVSERRRHNLPVVAT
jgi:hypothetical protein